MWLGALRLSAEVYDGAGNHAGRMVGKQKFNRRAATMSPTSLPPVPSNPLIMPMPSPVKRPKGEVQQLDLRSKVAALLMEEWPPLDTLDTLDDGMAEREELAYEIAEYIAKGGVVEYRWWAKWIGEIIRMQSFIDEASSPETATRTSKDSIEKDKHEIETQGTESYARALGQRVLTINSRTAAPTFTHHSEKAQGHTVRWRSADTYEPPQPCSHPEYRRR